MSVHPKATIIPRCYILGMSSLKPLPKVKPHPGQKQECAKSTDDTVLDCWDVLFILVILLPYSQTSTQIIESI